MLIVPRLKEGRSRPTGAGRAAFGGAAAATSWAALITCAGRRGANVVRVELRVAICVKFVDLVFAAAILRDVMVDSSFLSHQK